MSDVRLAVAYDPPEPEAVRAFLEENPEFLRDDQALMELLGVKPSAANIIDFGPAALSRAAQAHRKESSARQRLEATARANFQAQRQTHLAVLELMASRNWSELAARLDSLAQARFGLIAAVLALEGPERVPAGWRALAEGQVDLVMGPGVPARLGLLPTALGLFGEMADEIGSLVLIRLSLWAPARPGILAFGAGDAETFSPDMGHDLIDFLARVVERTAERWPSP